MRRKQFNIDINATREKVWKVLWGDATYRQWAAVFAEGSFAETDWQEGSSVLFLSPARSGMKSMILKKTENAFMSFKHLGEIKDGKEVPPNDKSKEWSGVTENYTLTENGGITKLKVEMDIPEDFESYFDEKFPLALQKVKSISESETK